MGHTKETRKKMSEARKKYLREHPEYGKQKSAEVKQYYKDHPEAIELSRAGAKKQWTDPKLRAKMMKIRKKSHTTKAFREKCRKRAIAQWQDPEFVAKVTEGYKRRDDKRRITTMKNATNRQKVKDNPQYDVRSKFYKKESSYLYQICKEIMNPYGVDPLPYQNYFYYEEIVEHFRPGWLALDRKRRYGIDPLNPED